MLNKIINVLKYLKKYKPSAIEEEFVLLNKNFWSRNNKKDYDDVCLVEGHVECPASVIDKARMAKAVEEACNARPVVFVRGFNIKGNNVAHIYKSFGIEDFYLWWRAFFNPLILIPSIISTVKIFTSVKTGDELLKLHYKDVYIGDLLYDTLIRFKPNSYTVHKINFSYIRLILRAFITFNINEQLIKKYKPKYLITSHNVYAEFGMFPRQIRKRMNGVVFLKDIYAYKCYSQKTNIQEHFLKMPMDAFISKLADNNYYEESVEYFNQRMSGNVDQIDVKNAYQNKLAYSITDLQQLYPGIDCSKKNVVVMSHAFSDSPHVGEGLLFKDYYDFLEKTLIKLNENSSINCFVKAHPSSYMWDEKGGVEGLVEKNNLSNVYIMPNDLNTNSISSLADYIVTAKGTAGLEFSCLGIPAITAGKGFYYNFGIAAEPDSIKDYYELLDNISDLKPLSEDIKKRALVLLYMVSQNRHHSHILPNKHIMPNEDYESLYQEKYKEVIGNIKKGEVMKDYYYEMVKKDAVKTK